MNASVWLTNAVVGSAMLGLSLSTGCVVERHNGPVVRESSTVVLQAPVIHDGGTDIIYRRTLTNGQYVDLTLEVGRWTRCYEEIVTGLGLPVVCLK